MRLHIFDWSVQLCVLFYRPIFECLFILADGSGPLPSIRLPHPLSMTNVGPIPSIYLIQRIWYDDWQRRVFIPDLKRYMSHIFQLCFGFRSSQPDPVHCNSRGSQNWDQTVKLSNKILLLHWVLWPHASFVSLIGQRRHLEIKNELRGMNTGLVLIN